MVTMEMIIYVTLLVLTLVVFGTKRVANKGNEKMISISNISFKSFQRSFFLVYFLALPGAWLQGPYVYKLFTFYGFKESQIAILYVAAFASSIVFGTFTGPLADKWGRRKMTITFTVIYTFCCLTKLSSNFWWLFAGQVLGGIATSLLFTTFEAWYVSEHSERQGFPSEWIGITFSISTFWFGIIAILAGMISNVTAETLGYGPVAPFVVALLPVLVCGVMVLKTWEENYGNSKSGLCGSCLEGLRIIFRDEQILLLGTVQSLLESCMYIFVFLWTPILDTGATPLGMVFSCFMVCIMVGSALFSILSHRGYTEANILKNCLVMISASMAVCCYTARPDATMVDTVISFIAFLVLEVAIGMYFPAITYLRSQVIPESHRATIMNWFRVPMNLITCGAFLCLHVDTISRDKTIVFAACFILAVTGTFLCGRFIDVFKNYEEIKTGVEETEKPGLLIDEDKQEKLIEEVA